MSSILVFDPEVYAEAFGRTAMLVDHNLKDEPLVELSEVVKLAEILQQNPAFVEHHLGEVPDLVPGGQRSVEQLPVSAAEIVRTIATNGSRISLSHLETVPRYRDLMNRVLDDIAPFVPRRDGGMRKRESFMFLNSASARVPAHADPEHNFLLQIHGKKTIRIGTFHDPKTIIPDLERQYRGDTCYLTVMPDELTEFVLVPGKAIYIPPEVTHIVDNGPEFSISLSVTFRTRVTERAIAAHRLNSRLRRLHVSPRPPGQSAAVDTAKATVMNQLSRVNALAKRVKSH